MPNVEAIISPVESCEGLPLVVTWSSGDRPLPRRQVRALKLRKRSSLGAEAPPWYQTGNEGEPFDFTARISDLCRDVALCCPDLAHVDVSRTLFCMTQARNQHAHGLQARVTPLRFQKGEILRKRRGFCYQVQRYLVDGHDVLYLITFCLPRFLNQTFDEKMVTLFHELWHVSPAFDGDLRRHGGRYDIHGRSKCDYDAHAARLAREYLATEPDPALHDFLRLSFAQLEQRHGRVVSAVVPRPKLIPVVLRYVRRPGKRRSC